MLTRHLAQALEAEWINVNAIAAGLFPSRMSAPIFSDDEAERTAGLPTGEFTIPLGRAGAPEDGIAATLYLCSRAGSYLTGVTIPLTGGVGTTD
jgi:NAD(P)-dependent dehydrogenase (short-subunit alcohol dehydrogenase family)